MEDYFTNDDCLQLVNNKVKKFDFLGYEFQPAANKRDIEGKLSVKIKEPGKNRWTVLQFQVKKVTLSGPGGVPMFSKEKEFYDKLLPRLKTYIKGKIFPDSYLAKKEFIILEDLSPEGYQVRESRHPFDTDHLEVALQAVAKLHAASLVLEKKLGTSLERILLDLSEEIMFVQDTENPRFDFLCSSISAVESILEHYFSHEPQTILNRANKLIISVPERLKMINSNTKLKVFSHGNLSNENIMFKYDEEGKPTTAVLSDFQISKYTSPAYDVLQVILMTSTMRENELEPLIIHYFNHLSRELAEEDIAVHSMITWSQFEQEVKSLLPVMLAISPIYLQYSLFPEKKQDKLMIEDQKDQGEMAIEAMRLNERYRKRISHSLYLLIEHLKQN